MMMLNGVAALLLLLAHDEKLSVSRVEVKDDGVVWTVDVSLIGIEKVLPLPVDLYDLSDRQFLGMKDDLVRYLRTCMTLSINGTDVEGAAAGLEPLYETFIATGEKYIAHARVSFRFASAAPVKRIELRGAFFTTLTSNHHAVLHVSWKEAKRQFSRYGPFAMELTESKVNPTFWGTAGEFLLWGMHHILIGFDHIAFLLALLLGTRKMGEMIRIVTSFTIAHSLTLLLAARDLIRLPSQVTESLIAASIVYVAAENYFIKEARWRWILTFAFGLVHGLGFSSMLRERLVDLDSVAMPVVWFNIGVELGQIAILLVAFPLLGWIRKGADEPASERRQTRLVRIGSAPILLLGLGWMADRIFQLEWMPF
jgi:hydrogenase/urease accessory protein HupE